MKENDSCSASLALSLTLLLALPLGLGLALALTLLPLDDTVAAAVAVEGSANGSYALCTYVLSVRTSGANETDCETGGDLECCPCTLRSK